MAQTRVHGVNFENQGFCESAGSCLTFIRHALKVPKLHDSTCRIDVLTGAIESAVTMCIHEVAAVGAEWVEPGGVFGYCLGRARWVGLTGDVVGEGDGKAPWR
jgi:hypothetical protein